MLKDCRAVNTLATTPVKSRRLPVKLHHIFRSRAKLASYLGELMPTLADENELSGCQCEKKQRARPER